MTPTRLVRSALALAGACLCLGANAQNSIGLAGYTLTGNYTLDTLGGMGLEASAVTFARDRGTLFFVGDEGLGVVEISLTGVTLGSMRFSAWPAASSNNDAEGLAYLGKGQLVVAEERLQDAFLFSYSAGGSVNLALEPSLNLGPTVGIEGITIDDKGIIYLVAEESGTPNSRLLVLSPIPEPETYALMLAGLAIVGGVVRRRKAA